MLIPWLFKETSIDDFIDQDGESRISQFMEDPRSVQPERELYTAQLVKLAREALGDLTEREKMILYRRFGLFGNDEMTLEEIGAVIGLSRSASASSRRKRNENSANVWLHSAAS
ncbi:MAG: hypothetical protein HC882_02290 [Acidobacteria bacterium]|nr:hypothetical protein [Acidobacteriota bacterium]